MLLPNLLFFGKHNLKKYIKKRNHSPKISLVLLILHQIDHKFDIFSLILILC